MEVVLDNLVQAQNIIEDIIPLKEKIERKINLSVLILNRIIAFTCICREAVGY